MLHSPYALKLYKQVVLLNQVLLKDLHTYNYPGTIAIWKRLDVGSNGRRIIFILATQPIWMPPLFYQNLYFCSRIFVLQVIYNGFTQGLFLNIPVELFTFVIKDDSYYKVDLYVIHSPSCINIEQIVEKRGCLWGS